MLETVIIAMGQFTVALFVRLAWHKYTDGIIRAINPFVIVMLVLLQLYLSGIEYLPFILGLFLVDFMHQYAKRNNQEIKVRNLLAKLVSLMPEKRENYD